MENHRGGESPTGGALGRSLAGALGAAVTRAAAVAAVAGRGAAWSLAAAVAVGAAGCAADRGVGSSSAAISGGEVDPGDEAVVGVVDRISATSEAICSGSLIAPNAVLTARHCVSVVEAAAADVECGGNQLGAVRPAADFLVSNAPTLPTSASEYLRVREVDVPTTAPGLCGTDLAILILAENVAASSAQPLLPIATGTSPQEGQGYAIVGYGEEGRSSDGGAIGVGTRRRRDGLAIRCVGAACGSPNVVPGEIEGTNGTCRGDSGGPALGDAGEVLGVTSRSTDDCTEAIFEDVSLNLAFLRATVVKAAALGDYTAPGWATESSSTPSVPTNDASSGGCSLAGSSRPAAPMTALLLVAAALLVRRRARTFALCAVGLAGGVALPACGGGATISTSDAAPPGYPVPTNSPVPQVTPAPPPTSDGTNETQVSDEEEADEAAASDGGAGGRIVSP